MKRGKERNNIWNMFRIFGCDVYVVNETGSKNTLAKATCHKFLGWGSSTSMIHYLDSSTNTIKRARHVYFDDFASATTYDRLSPGGILLRNESMPSIQPTPISPSEDDKISNKNKGGSDDKDAIV